MSKRSMIVWATAVGISFGCLDGAAHAADLTLTTGGKVSIELIFSEAGASHTLAMPQLFGVPVGVAERGCRLEPATGFTGQAELIREWFTERSRSFSLLT